LKVLPGALTPRLRHRLLQIADPVEDGMTKSGKAAGSPAQGQPDSSQYELSREKVAQAARWWRWEAVLAFLTTAAKKKPGPDLAVTLKGWAGDLAPAALTAVTILAAPSANWLDDVLLVPEVKSLILRR